MPLTIGEVADKTGLTPKAIRLYERRGLTPSPARTQAGYREYDDHDVAVLAFIQQARALGLGLEEIGEILDLQRKGEQPCGRVIELLDRHVREIDRAMAALRTLRASLVRTRNAARETKRGGGAVAVCRVIEQSPAQAPQPAPLFSIRSN